MKHTKSRPLRLFIFKDNKKQLEEEGLEYMQGQCQIILQILRKFPNMIWNSEVLSEFIEYHPEFTGNTPPKRVANYFIYRLKKAGVLEFYDAKTIESISKE